MDKINRVRYGKRFRKGRALAGKLGLSKQPPGSAVPVDARARKVFDRILGKRRVHREY